MQIPSEDDYLRARALAPSLKPKLLAQKLTPVGASPQEAEAIYVEVKRLRRAEREGRLGRKVEKQQSLAHQAMAAELVAAGPDELLELKRRGYLVQRFREVRAALSQATDDHSWQAVRDLGRMMDGLRLELDQLPEEQAPQTPEELVKAALEDFAHLPQSLQQELYEGMREQIGRGRLRVVEP